MPSQKSQEATQRRDSELIETAGRKRTDHRQGGGKGSGGGKRGRTSGAPTAKGGRAGQALTFAAPEGAHHGGTGIDPAAFDEFLNNGRQIQGDSQTPGALMTRGQAASERAAGPIVPLLSLRPTNIAGASTQNLGSQGTLGAGGVLPWQHANGFDGTANDADGVHVGATLGSDAAPQPAGAPISGTVGLAPGPGGAEMNASANANAGIAGSTAEPRDTASGAAESAPGPGNAAEAAPAEATLGVSASASGTAASEAQIAAARTQIETQEQTRQQLVDSALAAQLAEAREAMARRQKAIELKALQDAAALQETQARESETIDRDRRLQQQSQQEQTRQQLADSALAAQLTEAREAVARRQKAIELKALQDAAALQETQARESETLDKDRRLQQQLQQLAALTVANENLGHGQFHDLLLSRPPTAPAGQQQPAPALKPSPAQGYVDVGAPPPPPPGRGLLYTASTGAIPGFGQNLMTGLNRAIGMEQTLTLNHGQQTPHTAGAGPPGYPPPLPGTDAAGLEARTFATVVDLRQELPSLLRTDSRVITALRAKVDDKNTTLEAALAALLTSPPLIPALAALSCHFKDDPDKVEDHWLRAWLCLGIDGRRAGTVNGEIGIAAVTAQVTAALGGYKWGKAGVSKVLRRVAWAEEMQPSPHAPRTVTTLEDPGRQPFQQPQFQAPPNYSAPCVCNQSPCKCGSRPSAPMHIGGGHTYHTTGLPPPPPQPEAPRSEIHALTQALTSAFESAGGKSKEDDVKFSFTQYSNTPKEDLKFADRELARGNSLELGARLLRLLDTKEDDELLKKEHAMTPEFYEMVSKARVTAREEILNNSKPGELFQNLAHYVMKSQLKRMAMATEEAKVHISQQTGDVLLALQEHHEALKGSAHYGMEKDEAQRDILITSHERHIVAIALGFVQDPKLRRAHIQAGFNPRPALSAAVAPTVASTTGWPSAIDSGAAGAPKISNNKRAIGSCLPTSSKIMGAVLGTVKTSKCWRCTQIGHDEYECPRSYAQVLGVNMPGHDSLGVITDPQTYWKDGIPDSTISKEIASLWEKHEWAAEFTMDMTSKLNARAITAIASGF